MYAYKRDRRNLSSTGVSSSPLLSPSWKGSGQRPRRQSEGRPWSLIKPLHWPSLAGDGAHHETITWARRWSGMITLDLIAGHVGVGSAEKRNHINWCEKKEPSGSGRRTWPLGLPGGAMNGDPVHLDSTSLRLPPRRRHMHLDSLTSACQFSYVFDMWSWLIPAFPRCCKADLILQRPLGPLTESGAHVGPACQAGRCPWSPDYPAHCHRPAVSWPQWVLSRGIRAATPVSASDGETAGLQWLASACIFDPQKELRLGFARFLLTLRFLLSPGCVCVYFTWERIARGTARRLSPLLSPPLYVILQWPCQQHPHCSHTALPVKRDGRREAPNAEWGGNHSNPAFLGPWPQPGLCTGWYASP